MFLGIVNDGQFRRFCGRLGLEHLPSDARFATNAQRVAHRDALRNVVEKAIASHDSGALCESLMRVGVPAGVVNSVPGAFAHPHSEHRELVVRRGDYTGVRSPMRLLGTPGSPGAAPPDFARDTAEVLATLGIPAEERQMLHDTGAAPLVQA